MRESNASLEVHSANLSHILVEIWETLFEIQNITLSYEFDFNEYFWKYLFASLDSMDIAHLIELLSGDFKAISISATGNEYKSAYISKYSLGCAQCL